MFGLFADAGDGAATEDDPVRPVLGREFDDALADPGAVACRIEDAGRHEHDAPRTISAIDEGPDVDLPRPVPPPKPRDQRAERRTSASTARRWWRVPSSDVRAVRP